jgi:hypothetical protein
VVDLVDSVEDVVEVFPDMGMHYERIKYGISRHHNIFFF